MNELCHTYDAMTVSHTLGPQGVYIGMWLLENESRHVKHTRISHSKCMNLETSHVVHSFSQIGTWLFKNLSRLLLISVMWCDMTHP